MATNIIANVCSICGAENTYWHGLFHLSTSAYLVTLALVIFILIIIIKYAKEFRIETAFGKIKIPLIKRNRENTVNMCDLCKINVASLVTKIIELCQKIHKVELQNINEQLRELDNQFILEASWINNCHAQMISEKIKLRLDISEDKKTKIFMKNNQILNYIWLIKRQEIYDFLKGIILSNHFVDKKTPELRFFIYEKSKILLASLEGGVNLYPDWDDNELLFKRYEYLSIIIDRIKPRITESMHRILEQCQFIQQRYNEELKNAENEKIKIIEEFKELLPPKKKEE